RWRVSTPLTSMADPSAASLSANVLFTNVVTPVDPPQKNPPPHPAALPTIRLPAIVASEKLTIQIPPPDVHGLKPLVTLRAITLDRTTARRAAKSVTPPPLANPLFSVIAFSTSSAAESPPMYTPSPDAPLQPNTKFREIVLP